jgi:ubiquinone/menaquinone biosynthesis C-methylase UbiE
MSSEIPSSIIAGMQTDRALKPTVETYFRRYLEMAPLSLALWRSVEAGALSRYELDHPLLDLGCGFGEFAEAFKETKFDVGLDLSERDLEVAKGLNLYSELHLADARKLPFEDETFGSIISVSVLEHITEVDKVFKEAYRVLRPGGKLLITVETDEVDGNGIYRPLLKRIGLKGMSDFLNDVYNGVFHRETLLTKAEWRSRVVDAGFVIEGSEDIISPRVVKLFNIFLITAVPAQILRYTIGTRKIYRPKFATDLLTALFLPYVSDGGRGGTNLLILARK